METSVKITLIIVAAILLVLLVGYGIISSNSRTNTVSATGQASIKAIPDIVKVYFSLEAKAETAQEAKDSISLVYDELQTAMIKLGFERDEIQTSSYTVNPNYVWNGRTQTTQGYIANQQVVLEFSAEEADKTAYVIDAGVNAGAGISYINFELSIEKQNEYKAQAYEQAAEDARVKVESIVSGSGKKLGRLYSISASEFYYEPWRMYDMVGSSNLETAKAEVASISPSSQDITASVTAIYKIA